MFTVCPKCALTLIVTAADLRVAQGYVRCGRCSSVFNALPHLTDERPGADSASEPDGATPGPAPQPPAPEPVAAEPVATAHAQAPRAPARVPSVPHAAEPDVAAARARAPSVVSPEASLPPARLSDTSNTDDEAVPEDALEFDPSTTDVAALFVEPPPSPEWTAATGTFRAMLAALPQGAGEEPHEPSPEPPHQPPQHSSHQPPQHSSHQPPQHSSHQPPQHSSHQPPQSSQQLQSPPPLQTLHAAAEPAPPHPAREEFSHETPSQEAEPEHPLRRFSAGAWGAAAVIAALTLLAQIVHHHRDELAASARFNRPITRLYAALGRPLVPRWDLHAYDVRQLGAAADAAGGGHIIVRASIRNGASQPQPLPLLRVTLQDRFGTPLASSDVAPRAYLPSTFAASRFLAAGQRIDAEMSFVDPGANAVGFEIDACLSLRTGAVTCAGDIGTR
jgi:predicted Zn finger-like uncharacterized protein